MTAVGTSCLLFLAMAVPASAATTDEAIVVLESMEADDSAATREKLDRIESIDGVPIDLVALLDATGGDAALAAEILRAEFVRDPGPSVADTLESILAQERFARSSTTALERWLDRIGSWMTERLANVTGETGPTRRVSLIAAILVLAAVAFVTRLATRRRATVLRRRHTLDRLVEEGADPVDLERRAEEASNRGDYTQSVRLRFIAGILRLDQQGRIRFSRGLTTGEIADALSHPTFDELHRDFDRVVYGDEPADSTMDHRSRHGWESMLSKAGRT